MNSGNVLAGTDGCTSTTRGPRIMPTTAMSRTKLKLSLSYNVALIAAAASKPKERVAVRLRAHDRFGRDIAGCACPVLDYEWLVELLAEGLTQQAYEDVCAPTSWIANDRSTRSRWIGLRT